MEIILLCGRTTREAPFQCVGNISHHVMSAPNFAFSQMWSCCCLATFNREIALPRNDLPGLINILACCKTPISDSSSLQVHTFCFLHSLTTCSNLCSLPPGSLNSPFVVSIIVPSNVITGVGLSCFSVPEGIPNSMQIDFNLRKYSMQVSESGGPITAKIYIMENMLYLFSRNTIPRHQSLN